ncbi:MAG: hypothetical protein AAFV72_00245 [Cyanobacteria bacterium J06635_1]
MKNFLVGCGLLTILSFGGCVGLALLGTSIDSDPVSEQQGASVNALEGGSKNQGTGVDKDSYAEDQGRAVMITGVQSLDQIDVGNQFIDPVPGPIVWVDAKFKNTSNESGNFVYSVFKLVDTQGREYDEITDLAYTTHRDNIGLPSRGDDYYPGEEKPEAIAFRVAPDAEVTHIEWKGLRFNLN